MTRKGEAWKVWSQSEVNTLLSSAGTVSTAVIAKNIGRSKTSVLQKYQHLVKNGEAPRRTKGEARKTLVVSVQNDAVIMLPPKYLDMMREEAEKALIISDIHLPCIDWALFTTALRVGKTQRIKTCVVGGDLFDLKLFSTFADAKAAGSDELTMGQQAAVKFFTMLLDVFERVYVICGNHDFRVFRFTEGKIPEGLFFRFMTNISEKEKRVKFSAYRHMILNEKWRVVHPNSSGSDFVLEGRGEAAKYQQNIIVTHVHRCGWVFDASGKFIVGGSGALIDPTTQAYVMTIPSKAPMWNTGMFVVWGDGKYSAALPKYRTDWDMWTKRRIL